MAPSKRSPRPARTLGGTVAACLLGLAIFARPVGAQAPAPTPDPTTLFNNAVTSFDRGDYQGSITAIDHLLKDVPPNLSAADKTKFATLLEPIYFTLGAAYFNLKQYPQAITAMNDYLKRYPSGTRSTEITFSLAQASYFDKDYLTAAKGFATLEGSPGFGERALLLEGLSYREAADDGKAITALEKLVANGIKSPTAARGAMQLLGLYSRQKQDAKALKMLSAVQANIEQLENVVELNVVALEQGDVYLQKNANAEALTCYRAVRTREQVIALEHDRIAALQKRLEANKTALRASPKEASQYFLANRELQNSIAEDQRLVENFEKLPSIYAKVLYRIGRAFQQMNSPWEAVVAYQDSTDRSQDPADREPALFGVITANADMNQPSFAREVCNEYLKEFPKGTNADTVGYLLGATALQENDPKAAESYFGRMLAEQPTSTMREEMRFLIINAKLAQGKYPEARDLYSRFENEFKDSIHREEAVYRYAVCNLFAGNYKDAAADVDHYLQRYPSGSFVSDAKYRRAVCEYAMNDYDRVIADMRSWLKEFPDNPQQGEVQALLADAYLATGKNDEALATYQASYKAATTDEVLNYSLMAAGDILQKRRDWAADSAMFEDFVKTHPDHPTVVAALSQIGRAKARQGKVEEAKHFLSDTLKKYIDDPSRASVEQVLDQLALLCVRKKPAANVAAATPGASISSSPGAAEPIASSPVAEVASSSPAAPTDPGAELDELLGSSLADTTPTAQARILYAKAQLALLRRQPAEAERNFLAIAEKFKPATLSPTILGDVGDALLAKGKPDAATVFYQTLADDYPKDLNVDFAYAGLAEIAFQKKQYAKALELFRDGMEKIAPSQKVKELTVGQAKSLLALGKYPEAKKLFEQAASVREWRGDTTAFCVYSLGEIEAKQGHWAEANSYYQRVFVAYQRFLPWVAKSYLGSADSLEKLGKKDDAIRTYQEMLRNPKLTEFHETGEARQRLQALNPG